ncbi:MAG TPA: methyltransferase domain-containing protein [Mycobacteriales bacterium]|nr:methyltransferase domain-containing protein [Mycobacteriales bacterium]
MIPAGEMWDRRFAEHGWPTEPDPLLVELATALPPGRALDVGSGPGRNSLWLAARGWEVTAADASQVALAQASQRAEALGVRLETVHVDVTDWQPVRAAYDLVVVANLHPGAAALASVLVAAADALVAGGHLFVVGHDLANLGVHGPPDAAQLFSVERLAAAMPPAVSIQLLERRIRPPDAAALDDAGPGREDVAVLAWATKSP